MAKPYYTQLGTKVVLRKLCVGKAGYSPDGTYYGAKAFNLLTSIVR